MSSYPPPPDAPDVLPSEDGGDYASRHAEAAAIADAARLPEWVLLAEIARRQRHGRAAPDDAALAERLWRASWTLPPPRSFGHSVGAVREQWLRVAAEARAAIGESVGHVVLTDDEARRMIESERLTTHRVLPVSVEDRIVVRFTALPAIDSDRCWCGLMRSDRVDGSHALGIPGCREPAKWGGP